MGHEMEDREGGAGGQEPARKARRDSLFLLTVMTSPDGMELGSARVRNLSATGMMADIERPLAKGDRVSTELRGVGRVSGTVAWARDDRVGIAFDEPIDPQLARKPVGSAAKDSSVPSYLRPLGLARR